jgi:hypothetical protein
VQKKIATGCLLFAWLCATGAVSDVAQVLAWSRMFAGYARVLSVREAIVETFDASKPCELCLAVKKDRAAEDAQPGTATLSAEKFLLAYAATPSSELFTSQPENWPAATDWKRVARTEAVPVRPPRA